jgi:LPXTG-site transpeptidase (sortase) family protein
LINPLFPNEPGGQQPDPPKQDDNGYVLRKRHGRTIAPLHTTRPSQQPDTPGSASAVELIRNKVASLYAEEPNARQEIAETQQQPVRQLSKHQQFMHQLSTSGKSLAQIQTEWHNYYLHLPTEEKHEVWQEFYANNSRQPSAYTKYVQSSQQPAAAPVEHAPQPGLKLPPASQPGKAVVAEHAVQLPERPASNKRAVAHIKRKIINRVISSNEAQVKAKQHLKSLAFGLSTGLVVLFVMLFGFFNEMFIAPFIQPSRHVSATPIIVGSDSVAPGAAPEVIVPKINVQIPVVYNQKSVDEAAIQESLEQGIIHYPTTVVPGQKGNAAFFGHSSNNIFNKGKYKFAFVLLHELVPGDIFYLTYNGKIYTYKVFAKKVVSPTQLSVLNNVPGKVATAALITCDPPGTSTNRLVVWGEQISPSPTGAETPVTPPSTAVDGEPEALPSDGPTMWSRFWNWVF